MVPTQISCTFFPYKFFFSRFFLASVETAFALLAVAQLYQLFMGLCLFSSWVLYFRFILYCTYIVPLS